jgi:hypothetical protein
MLRTFADPLRAQTSHFTLENNLSAGHQLIKARRNDSSSVTGQTEGNQSRKEKETERFFHLSYGNKEFLTDSKAKSFSRNFDYWSRS